MKSNSTINFCIKNYTYVFALLTMLLICIMFQSSVAQTSIYGSTADQGFTRIIPDGNNFYVLGHEGSKGTIARINNNGVCLWSRILDSQSAITDGIVTPNGLLFIGFTLPFTNTNQSIVGEINANGVFDCIKYFDGPGNEVLARIVEVSTGNYLAVGYNTNTTQDVVLYSIRSPNCAGWRKQEFTDTGNDSYGQDILVPAPGGYMICGSDAINQGVIYHLDLNGNPINGVQGPGQYIYVDIENTQNGSGDILAAANPLGSGNPYIARFDQTLQLPIWEQEITGINSISQIITDANGFIYVVGNAIGLNRYVVIKLNDNNGGNPPLMSWPNARYLDNTNIDNQVGHLVATASGLAYADGRTYSSGFGQLDNFLGITNADLFIPGCTQESMVNNFMVTTLFNGSFPTPLNFVDLQIPSMETGSDLPCNRMSICSAPCNADFSFALNNTCGYVSFTNLSSGTPGLTYCWDFDNNGTCESTLMDPNWTFPGPACQTFPVTLTITCGDGSTDSYTLNVTIADVQPPTIVCPPNLTLSCNDDTSPGNSGLATANDKCTLFPIISYSDNIVGSIPCNGVIERIWTATDDCNNTSGCTQYITVVDNTPPFLTLCPNDVSINVQNTSAPCQSFVTMGIPLFGDNCDLNLMIKNDFNNSGDASGNYSDGTTVVIWTATDDCGNTATCSVSVTVNCNPFCGFKCGQAIVSFSSTAHSSQIGHVLEVIDLTANTGTVTQNWNYPEENWNAPMCHHPDWTAANMGEIFGIAIDKNNDVFVTASKTYANSDATSAVGSGGTGGIYKISHVTGVVTPFVTTDNNTGASCASSMANNKIPNKGTDGPGLGSITYDEIHDQFFVTNFEDGKIYQIDAAGNIIDCLDPFLPAGTTGGVEPYDEMIWGIGVVTTNSITTLYFGRWRNDLSQNGNIAGVVTKNEIHSIVLPGGNFPSVLPTVWNPVISLDINYTWHPPVTNPISDIEFSRDGKTMLVSESTSFTYFIPVFYTWPNARFSRVFEYSVSTGGVWTLSKTYFIGNPNSQQNAAGGVDYGYLGVDPTSGTVYDCDQVIWSTGDELKLGTNNDIGGLAGIPVIVSNTPSQLNNYYIDLDNDLNEGAHDQRLIGDIDIFKCGCPTLVAPSPCETVFATVASSGTPGRCQWSLSFEVQEENISHVEFEAITPGVIINSFDLTTSEFELTIGGTNQRGKGTVQIKQPGGHGITEGSYADIAEFSLGNIDQISQQPQRILVNWFVDGIDGSLLFCSDTIIVDCPPPSVDETCWSSSVISTSCDLSEQTHNVVIDITNLSESSFTHVAIEDNYPDDQFTLASQQIQSLSEELLPGSTTAPIEITLRSSQFILDAEEVSLDIILYSDSSYCRSSIPFSAIIETCCLPCEGSTVNVDPEFSDPDACNFTLDIDNGCAANYFIRIETEIITPGVKYNEVEVSASATAPWYFSFANNREIHWTPVGSFVPFGNLDNLIQFGLTDIVEASQDPQIMEIRWIAKDENGQEFVACSENITLTCQPVILDSCIILVDHLIECLPDGSQIVHFTIENNSEHTITDFSVHEIDPLQVTVTPSIFSNVDLEPGERWSDAITVVGSESGGPLNLNFQFTEESPPELDNIFYTQWRCYDDLSFLLPDCVTSTKDIEEEYFKIYPNPTNGNIFIELSKAALKNTTIRILNTSGSKLLEKNVEPGNIIQMIETSHLAEGMYFIQIVSGNHVLSVNKFIKM